MLNHLANEASLVEEARAGNAQAFTSLVNHYERNIYRLALNITASPQDAEDVLQETFLKAYIKLGQFRGQSRFYTWLVRIAVNESLMNLRRQRKSRRWVSLDEPIQTEGDKPLPQEIVDWEENPEQRYARQELQQILIRAIQHLEPGYRATFVMRQVQDLSIQETATLLHLSVPTVKSRLFRAAPRSQFFSEPISRKVGSRESCSASFTSSYPARRLYTDCRRRSAKGNRAAGTAGTFEQILQETRFPTGIRRKP